MNQVSLMSKKQLIRQALHLIDNWIDYQVYIKEIPGVSVGISLGDEVIFRKEYGYANLMSKTKLIDQHLFRIASHSKLFTATAIMKLYYEDRLSIDDRISKYLPWFASASDHNLNQIRISHILTHTSGVTRDGETGHWIKHEFPEVEEIKSQTNEGITYFETNEIFKYSNFGFTILGQVIESVTGQSYQEYVQKAILDPLEMTNTFVDYTQDLYDTHATGHKRKLPKQSRDLFDHIPAKVMAPATGFSSTTDDLIKFYKAHQFGNDVLFPDYIKREMQSTQFHIKDFERGLGFSIIRSGDDRLVGHGGGYPGFITLSRLNQDQKLILVVLTNAIDGPAYTLLEGIEKIIQEITDKKDKFQSTTDENSDDFEDIVGFYASDWGTILFSHIGSRLVSINPGLDNPVEFFQVYEHKQANQFINPREPSFASPGQLIEFVEGPDGEKLLSSAGAEIKQFNYTY
jgi:CubicO group peptidase (beta-lactamase class C family)